MPGQPYSSGNNYAGVLIFLSRGQRLKASTAYIQPSLLPSLLLLGPSSLPRRLAIPADSPDRS